jgi:hypothetical protein
MENEIVTPLTDGEIKDGIAHKVAEAVRAKLDQYGPLYGKSFPKFNCSGVLHLRLDNFGLVSESYHVIDATNTSEVVEGEQVSVDVVIPDTPPNAFRRETEQAVPVISVENGKPVERAVLYQAKKSRPPRS